MAIVTLVHVIHSYVQLLLSVPGQGCAGPVASMLTAGPLRRGFATLAAAAGARETAGAKR